MSLEDWKEAAAGGEGELMSFTKAELFHALKLCRLVGHQGKPKPEIVALLMEQGNLT